MSVYDQKATAYLLRENATSPETHLRTRVSNYNVAPGTSPTFIAYSGSVSRLAVAHSSGVAIGNIPFNVTFSYRRIGNPEGVLSIGIRKAAGDTFTLLAQHPVGEPRSTGLITAGIEGFSTYQMVANDKISLEYPPDSTNTIELACGSGLPAGFTSQQYTGSYAATAAPIAVKVRSKVLTPT